MSNSVRPHRWQPTRLPSPWDSPGKNTGVGCHFFLQAWKWKVKVKSLSRVWLLATLQSAAHQASPSMGFLRQEYWSGVPLPSPTHTHTHTHTHFFYPFNYWSILRLCHILAIVNNAAMNIVVHAYFWISIFVCLGINTLLDILLANIFSHSVDCLSFYTCYVC